MPKKAIIYLHGFNSASVDLQGNLLTSKEKLAVMQAFCQEKTIVFDTPNVDYRDFENIVEDMLYKWNFYLDRAYDVYFMGSPMGGFASEYLAMKTGCHAIMINPAIKPSALLPQFIGLSENSETGQAYQWDQAYCDQYPRFEQELSDNHKVINRTLLLDRGDELIDTQQTIAKYQGLAELAVFDGGSHSFEHMREALPVVERVIFS